MEQEKIIEKIKEKATNGKISCTEARKLAENLNVEKSEIGKACDEAGVKLYGCELGCF